MQRPAHYAALHYPNRKLRAETLDLGTHRALSGAFIGKNAQFQAHREMIGCLGTTCHLIETLSMLGRLENSLSSCTYTPPPYPPRSPLISQKLPHGVPQIWIFCFTCSVYSFLAKYASTFVFVCESPSRYMYRKKLYDPEM